VYVKSNSKVGVIRDYNDGFELWRVDHTDGSTGAYLKHELEPLLTLDQVVDIKLREQEPGSDLRDKVKDFGMSSQDLADFCQEFILECVGRVKGVGNDQYNRQGFQRFEERELDQVLEDIEEEILDIPNYLAMLFIRVRRLRQAMDSIDTLGDGTEEEYEGGTITADYFKEEQ
jgi:hypothetical protein